MPVSKPCLLAFGVYFRGTRVCKNDAANGVFLSTVKGISDAACHPGLHTKDYYEKVNKLLGEAKNKDDALDTLKYISEVLQNGTFMK